MAVRTGQGIPEAAPERPVSKEYLKRKQEGTNNPPPCRPVENDE